MARGRSAVQIEIEKSVHAENHQHHQQVSLHQELNVGTVVIFLITDVF